MYTLTQLPTGVSKSATRYQSQQPRTTGRTASSNPEYVSVQSGRAGFFSSCTEIQEAIADFDWPPNGFKIDISLVSAGFKHVDEFNNGMIRQQATRHCRLIDQCVQEIVLGRRRFRSGKTVMPSIVVPERWSRIKDGTPSLEIPLHYHGAFIMAEASVANDIVELLEPKMMTKLKKAIRPCEGFGERFDNMDVKIEPIITGESCKVVSYAAKYAYDLIQHAVIRLP